MLSMHRSISLAVTPEIGKSLTGAMAAAENRASGVETMEIEEHY